MTPSTAALERAITVWPKLAELRRLDGWAWTMTTVEDGLTGEQPLGGPWLNALVVFGPDDAFAARLRAISADEHETTWLAEGPIAEVLVKLARLPLPGRSGAPTRARPVTVLPPPGSSAPIPHGQR